MKSQRGRARESVSGWGGVSLSLRWVLKGYCALDLPPPKAPHALGLICPPLAHGLLWGGGGGDWHKKEY